MYIIEEKNTKKIQVQYETFSNDIVQICKRQEMLYSEHLGTIKNHVSSLSKHLYNSVTEKNLFVQLGSTE